MLLIRDGSHGVTEDGACLESFIGWHDVTKKLIVILATVFFPSVWDHDPTVCRGPPGSRTLIDDQSSIHGSGIGAGQELPWDWEPYEIELNAMAVPFRHRGRFYYGTCLVDECLRATPLGVDCVRPEPDGDAEVLMTWVAR
jgi:hypothetical protein